MAEPLKFDMLEIHDGAKLSEVDHVIPIPVLDQEDLHKQGIDVSTLVPGAQDVDALGSCTCNTGTAHIAEVRAAVQSGVAGGHETLQHGIPQLAQKADGSVDLANTVIKVRNSWSTQFGLDGDYLLHASTLNYLSRYYDYKSVVI